MTAERDDLAHIIWGHPCNLDNRPSIMVDANSAHLLAKKIREAGYDKPQYLSDEELYSGGGDTQLPDDTFVESADGSVWRVEPDFGWDCVSSGSARLSGPARLLVLGGGQE